MWYNITIAEVWLSLVERFVRDEEAVGSNPVTSTSNVHNFNEPQKPPLV